MGRALAAGRLGSDPPDVHTGQGDLDLPVELARRALLQTVGTRRATILAALDREAGVARIEEEERLNDAFVARGIDWTPDPSSEQVPVVNTRVAVRSERLAGDDWKLVATVTNPSDDG